MFLRIFLDVLHTIFQKVFLYCCYYYCLHTTVQFPIFTKFLCVIFQSFVFVLRNISEHISHDILKQFFLCLKNMLPLLDAAILSSASICFKESEVKHQIYFICYSSTLLFLWGKFDLCRLHSFWDLTHYALTLYCFYFLQCNLSCRAIHRGPVLPALFGSSEDPTTVPGSNDHLGCWNLMLNKKITWETSIWLSHCTISLGRMVISRNDVFQFDVNFTLLLFRSFLHLSLCFIDRRSTPHNMSSLIKIFSNYKFSQRNFFSQKSQLFFFFTPPVQERKVHSASISACQYLHLSV